MILYREPNISSTNRYKSNKTIKKNKQRNVSTSILDFKNYENKVQFPLTIRHNWTRAAFSDLFIIIKQAFQTDSVRGFILVRRQINFSFYKEILEKICFITLLLAYQNFRRGSPTNFKLRQGLIFMSNIALTTINPIKKGIVSRVDLRANMTI